MINTHGCTTHKDREKVLRLRQVLAVNGPLAEAVADETLINTIWKWFVTSGSFLFQLTVNISAKASCLRFETLLLIKG